MGSSFFTIYERDARVCLCADGDELVERERPIMQRTEEVIAGAGRRRR